MNDISMHSEPFVCVRWLQVICMPSEYFGSISDDHPPLVIGDIKKHVLHFTR